MSFNPRGDMRTEPGKGEVRIRRRAFAVVASLFALTGLAGAGCGGPKYPLCDNDEGCTQDGHTGVCVAGKCVECRDDKGCGAGKSCQSGGCTDIPGFCDPTHACPDGSSCGKDNHCAEVKKAPPPFVECDDSKVCGPGSHCQNGHCVKPPNGGPGCTDFPSPHFDYESPEVRGESRETLVRLASCITKGTLKGQNVLVTGHCDARGEQEFNMSLGENRAEAVKNFLITLGVPATQITTSSRGKLDAVGQDEAGWAQDRRVDLEVR
ncbi:MAG: OmpA family protein [Polyangiaceae bacterium]